MQMQGYHLQILVPDVSDIFAVVSIAIKGLSRAEHAPAFCCTPVCTTRTHPPKHV